MKNKVIFVLVDALGFDVATKHFGLMEHLTEAKKCAKYKMKGELPSISRPMYETLMTGLPVWKHGILSNEIVRPSAFENLFSITKAAGKVNAVAGYMWMLELYGAIGRRFDLSKDRFCLNGSGDIMHGIFYQSDFYRDDHLFSDADFLMESYQPDFLLIHPMGVDEFGHMHGSDSKEYSAYAAMNCDLIAQRFTRWTELGYQIVVTGDHGMDPLGLHEGNEPIQRDVPLYIVSDRVEGGDFTADPGVTSLCCAPLTLELLGLPRGKDMIEPNMIRGLLR
ncbi:MAG: alkaline phosphatase family protein [Clostridia bacterium]|nr:alkaline phosphatase family protein [Clostridia bacterium]